MIWKKAAKPAAANHQSQRGVALVITVILLAVVTFMALTFLAISRRERGSVTTSTDATTAQLAADDALAAAEAQIVANTLASTNPYNFGLLVSTNYVNLIGYQSGVASPTNVNYYYPNGAQVTPANIGDFLQLLANLYYNPRVPVYMSNTVTRAPTENRFYLDLNRDGQDEPSGWVTNLNNNGNGLGTTSFQVGDPEWIGVLQHPDQPYGPNNPFVARYAFVAVPIGNALDLNAIHNQARTFALNLANDGYFRNEGVGSWEINLAAFLADLNTNSWDNNLSGTYQYLQPSFPNRGAAFNDALSLLSYRYIGYYGSLLPPAANFYSGLVWNGIDDYAFGNLIPNSTTGTGLPLVNPPPPFNGVTPPPWPGADNTNHFFDSQELFNASETAAGVAPAQVAAGNDFTGRLLAAGGNPSTPNSTYNRYTYYRLLSQMGVDSAPEQNQINLNYSNAYAFFDAYGELTNITYYPGAETNLTPWTPLQFFTIAADRMLRAYTTEWRNSNPTNFAATFYAVNNFNNINNANQWTNYPPFGLNGAPGVIPGIPVVVSNQFVYTPAVQRVLQLAANIYDATTNNFGANGNTRNFPSVFRPIFEHDGYGNVFIVGYTNLSSVNGPNTVSGAGDAQLELPYDVQSITNLGSNFKPITDPITGVGVNVFGVPWIVGAKKGFPNFNKFDMESAFQLTRKLQVTRPSTNDFNFADYRYNQQFILSVTNQFGVECWNSYSNSFNDSVAIYAKDNLTHAALTNDEGFSADPQVLITPTQGILGFIQIPPGNVWPGYNPVTDPLGSLQSFQIPLYTNVTVITNSTYLINGLTYDGISYPPFSLTTNLALPYEQNVSVTVNGQIQSYPQPHWFLTTSNEFQVFMLDTTANHIIDYAQIAGPNSTRDLTTEIITNYDAPVNTSQSSATELWNTNIQTGALGGPVGLISQIGVSLNLYTAPDWNTTTIEVQNEIDGFRAFFGLGALFTGNPGEAQVYAEGQMTNAIQSPYTATATVVQHVSWQANDPLVHYEASDLNWPSAVIYDRTVASLTNNNPNGVLGQLNQSYRPWGGNWKLPNEDQNPFSLSLKDPLVWQSDDWDFPTYKLPTAGWLGRVHRGTPWQTVYLKAPSVLQGIQVIGGVTNYVGTNVWEQWTGDSFVAGNEYYDAINTAPVQDRLLFDLFTTAPNDNASRGTLSVNVDATDQGDPQAGLAAWSALLSGVQVLSNNASDAVIGSPGSVAQHNGAVAYYTPFPINPAGPAGVNSALGQIVAGINSTRAGFVNADGLSGTFEHVGDILSVPQLSSQSPFLNWSNSAPQQNNITIQQEKGISDEMYEWLPQQVMSLLRASGTPQSPMRYVIYSYGQALKPAPNSIYTGSQTINLGNGQTASAFGMVTNYQVVAESATRAVVNFGSVETNIVSLVTNYYFFVPITNWVSLPVVTNNQAQIVQYNVLPPF